MSNTRVPLTLASKQAKPSHNFTTGLLILQPTTFCNIDCRYCYLPDRSRTTKMSLDTVATLLPNLAASGLLGPKLTVVWHAGEPLAVPLAFYQNAFPILRQHNQPGLSLSQAIQTNATLVTEAHCELFQQEAVHISVSIDGPEFLHDRQRIGRDGRGTFQRVMNGVRLLQKHRIPINAICVLTAESLDYADAIYEFFVEQHIGEVGFNIDELEGSRHETSYAVDVADKYRAFMTRMLERTTRDKAIQIREFREMRQRIRHADGPTFNNQTQPFSIISVSATGDFTTFSPELLGQTHANYPSFTLGNVHQGLIADALTTPLFQRLYADVHAGVEQCAATCEYYGFCGGGGPSNKVFENGTFASTETRHCRYTVKELALAYLAFMERSLGVAS